MNKKVCAVVLLMLMCLLFSGCNPYAGDDKVWLNMNTNYSQPTNLPDGNGQRVKVVLLLGQSNATGCGINSYLKQNIGDDAYATYEQGFENVWINYCVDDHNNTSNGEFVKVDLTCGAGNGFFGPEVGMAETFAMAYPNETVIILKYSMSGYSLHYHWLCQGERGSIYQAMMGFVNTYMDALLAHNYDARIGTICWMQGESDTTDFKAKFYLDNQIKFVSYLRQDLATYAQDGEIYFVDAGISNSPYCEPAYPKINKAKVKFSKLSHLNMYFSTIDQGLTVHLEPHGDPDWGHYDSLSTLKLGHLFGEYVVNSYKLRG